MSLNFSTATEIRSWGADATSSLNAVKSNETKGKNQVTSIFQEMAKKAGISTGKSDINDVKEKEKQEDLLKTIKAAVDELEKYEAELKKEVKSGNAKDNDNKNPDDKEGMKTSFLLLLHWLEIAVVVAGLNYLWRIYALVDGLS